MQFFKSWIFLGVLGVVLCILAAACDSPTKSSDVSSKSSVSPSPSVSSSSPSSSSSSSSSAAASGSMDGSDIDHPMPVTAEILSTDYYKMAVPDADAIYNGKWISVTGVVKSKSLNANPGVITVCLKCIHDFALIDCRFDPRWKLDLEKIKGVDQVVTIKGKCTTRKLNNIIILDCVLVKA